MGLKIRGWISEAGGGLLYCQELDQLVHIEQDVKRLLPLVRFSLMNSQFFRRDLSCRFALQMLIQMFGQESCEVRPSAWAGRGGGGGAPFLHRSPCQVRPHSFVEGVTPQYTRSPRSLVLAFGGWSRNTSGSTGPSSDILLFNPAARFYTTDDRIKYKVIDQVLVVPGLAPATGDRRHLRSR